MLTYDMEARGSRGKTVYLYEQIKKDILTGALAAGERLPSKRDLAEHLSVSVITAEHAYIMLEEEGYIEARPRSGYYVLPLTLPKGPDRRDTEIRFLPEEPAGADTGNVPEAAGLSRIIRRILTEQPDIMLRKPPHEGCAVLRNAIAAYLGRYRGMRAQPENIIIGSGAEYLYGMLVQLFGRRVIFGIESPSYEKIESVYRVSGVMVEHLTMGRDGITSEALSETNAEVLHVTPFHSYPSGVTAGAGKRYEYLRWARDRGGYVIEDDFDSELTFFRKPIETLYAMDGGERVIYMNTFSKSIAPGIRIAYMVLPEPLLQRYREGLGFYSCTVPVFDQYVLARFIDSGAFERHLGRLRRAGRS